MLVRFDERVFLHETSWYVWDTAIGMFRPIHGFSWDGYQMVLNDECYTADPMDDTYGFGSAEMYKTCMELTNLYEDKIAKAPTASFLDTGDLVWFRDRPISLTSCAPRDLASWKRLVKGRPRTCRRHAKNKFTKRNL